MSILINELNKVEFLAFPHVNSKTGKPGVTLSIIGEDGQRHFLTRAAVGINQDGTAKYQWVIGNAMRAQAQAPQAPVQAALPVQNAPQELRYTTVAPNGAEKVTNYPQHPQHTPENF